MPPSIPRRNRPVLASLASRPLAAFPVFSAGRLPRCPFRGLLNVHCTLSPARSLNRPRRPFSIAVLQSVSLPPRTAPITSGWSDSCRAGFAPAEKQRLSTAHEKSGLGRQDHPRLGVLRLARTERLAWQGASVPVQRSRSLRRRRDVKRLLIELYDRKLISRSSLQLKMDLDPDIEAANRDGEKQSVDLFDAR